MGRLCEVGVPVAVATPSDEFFPLGPDPFGRLPVGAFFGGEDDVPDRPTPAPGSLGLGPWPFLAEAGSLPTAATLEAVSARFGAAAAPLLGEWRTLWDDRTGGRIDAVAERHCLRGLDGRDGPNAVLADRFRRGLGDRADAKALFMHEAHARLDHDRGAAFHALEDAARHVAMAREGVAATWVARGPWPFRWSVVGGDAGDDAEAERLQCDLRRAVAFSPRYWQARAFRSCCGRRMRVASGARHAVAVLLDMARQGHRRAFLKSCETKAGTWVADLSGATTLDGACAAFARALGCHALDPGLAEGREILVQEFVPFAYERRFFVAGSRVVASTPSDRRLTPLDAGPDLDGEVATLVRPAGDEGQYDRGETGRVRAPALVAAMTGRVEAFLGAVSGDADSGAALGDAFVVDVGSDGLDPASATVGIVEVNALRLSGTYGLDHAAFARALT